MPMTVSRNSPSTNILPSTSRPSPTKNAVTMSRSATVMPRWSKRRACDMGSSFIYSSCRSTPETAALGPSLITAVNHPDTTLFWDYVILGLVALVAVGRQ